MSDQPTERPDRDAPMQGVVDDPAQPQDVDVNVTVNGQDDDQPELPEVPDDEKDDEQEQPSESTDG